MYSGGYLVYISEQLCVQIMSGVLMASKIIQGYCRNIILHELASDII
jgi:hypothetical protein